MNPSLFLHRHSPSAPLGSWDRRQAGQAQRLRPLLAVAQSPSTIEPFLTCHLWKLRAPLREARQAGSEAGQQGHCATLRWRGGVPLGPWCPRKEVLQLRETHPGQELIPLEPWGAARARSNLPGGVCDTLLVLSLVGPGQTRPPPGLPWLLCSSPSPRVGVSSVSREAPKQGGSAKREGPGPQAHQIPPGAGARTLLATAQNRWARKWRVLSPVPRGCSTAVAAAAEAEQQQDQKWEGAQDACKEGLLAWDPWKWRKERSRGRESPLLPRGGFWISLSPPGGSRLTPLAVSREGVARSPHAVAGH